MIVNIALWLGGLALLVGGIAMIRGPLARYQELQRTEENLRRYDSWRGGSRRTAADTGRTGADEMKEQMRQRVLLWGAAIVAGIVLIVAGFAVR